MTDSILVKKDELYKDSEQLKKELLMSVHTPPPNMVGSGQTVEKLNELANNMNEIYNQVNELFIASANMLKKMGYEFEELDEISTKLYENLHFVCLEW